MAKTVGKKQSTAAKQAKSKKAVDTSEADKGSQRALRSNSLKTIKEGLLDDSDMDAAADMRKVNTTQFDMKHVSFGTDKNEQASKSQLLVPGKRNFRQHQGGQANLKVSTRKQDSTMIRRTNSMNKVQTTELTPTIIRSTSGEFGKAAKKDNGATAGKLSRSSSLRKEQKQSQLLVKR